jgi:heme/copper-type cytochrome/quinol oxidase subunit 3
VSRTASRSVVPQPGAAARDEDTARLGLVLFVGSWAMLFASLFFAYGVLRVRQPAWPPAGTPALPRLLPLVNTLVLAWNAIALQRALAPARRGDGPKLSGSLWEAFVSGGFFLLLQLLLWTSLSRAGLALSDGSLAAVVYGLTGVHAVHVVVGLLGLAWLLVATRKGEGRALSGLRLRSWVRYWHFVFLAWVVMYLLLFVL